MSKFSQNIPPIIYGTCSDKHMQEDLGIFNVTLTEDEVNQVKDLLQN